MMEPIGGAPQPLQPPLESSVHVPEDQKHNWTSKIAYILYEVDYLDPDSIQDLKDLIPEIKNSPYSANPYIKQVVDNLEKALEIAKHSAGADVPLVQALVDLEKA